MLTDEYLRADLERATWYLLRAIDASRPISASEETLHSVLDGADFRVTPREVRRALDYLEKCGLVTLTRPPRNQNWLAELTAEGIRFVSYEAPDMPGIRRPRPISERD